ncbi:MAG: hypothetical protein WDA16_05980 [Candidatus Thermoplasmatota archaeon]
MLHEACSRCGRTLLELRRDANRDSMRGSAPLCQVPRCPLVQKVLGFEDAPAHPGTELMGPSPPAVFVGRYGYPKVALGPLLPPAPEMAAPGLAETPAEWARKLDIADILAMRSRLVRSKATMDVTSPRDQAHALEASRALAMTDKPLDTEVTLKKPPKLDFEPKVDGFAAPMGPSVTIIDARVLSSPSVPRKVDSIVSDIHADAATGTMELYDGGISAYHIQRLLSVGLLGQERRRKLVPTRWSITATDDILGKQLIEQVKGFATVDAPLVFSADLFGNYFHVLLMPRVWAYEMIEAWQGDDGWMAGHDLEPYAGRASYADSITGAYYAARLSVLEWLIEQQRQASVFVYREITEDYWAPLGVWVIREAVKMAMQGKGLVFEDIASAVRHIARRSRNGDWTKTMVLPKEAHAQRTLRDFLL